MELATTYTRSKLPGQARRSHVADRYGDCVGTGLTSELFDHLRRELDAMYGDRPRTERQSNPARSNGKLQCNAIANQLGE